MFLTSREEEPWRTRASGFQGKSLRETPQTKKTSSTSRKSGGEIWGGGGSPARRVAACWHLSSLPFWRTGESVYLKKKENSKPVLENWSVGDLNPLCKRKWVNVAQWRRLRGGEDLHAKLGAQEAEGLGAAVGVRVMAPFPICHSEQQRHRPY